MQESQLGRYIVIGIVSLIILFGIIRPATLDVIRYKQLPTKGIYSIGEITNIIDDRFTAASVNFTFTYKNNSYFDVVVADKYDQNLIGRKFFVLFHPKHPEMVKMLLDKPVPNNITTAPIEGWKKLP